MLYDCARTSVSCLRNQVQRLKNRADEARCECARQPGRFELQVVHHADKEEAIGYRSAKDTKKSLCQNQARLKSEDLKQ